MTSANSSGNALVWFRRDLRLLDNPALHAAVQRGRPITCALVDDPGTSGALAPGGAARWWQHHSIATLAASLATRGNRLILRRGDPSELIPRLARECQASEVFWNRADRPDLDRRDYAIAQELDAAGVKARGFRASTLIDPATHLNGSGQPYRVFTPFWKAALKTLNPRDPIPAPDHIPAGPDLPSDHLDDWGLLPSAPNWADGFAVDWEPGEAGAHDRLDKFLDGPLPGYPDDRDRPDMDATSRLSPHLAWGEISPRVIWHRARGHAERSGAFKATEKFLSEVGWRDFAIYLAHHFDDLRAVNFNRQFDHFPWQANPDGFVAWTRGQTGIPIVDAAMRQLWTTGWMHNRTRMIVASVLIKHLGVHWKDGMAWFEDTLVDADLNVNAASWQWVAGSGADAAPYFRIFNPVSQGEKFDPKGEYVRRWVPELSGLDTKAIHAPWEQPAGLLAMGGVTLGQTYPRPIVDLKQGREAALAAYQHMKAEATQADENADA